MLTQQEKKEIEQKLNQCGTVAEVFNILQSTYDLKNTKLGFASKGLFISGCIKGIELTGAKRLK